MTGSAKPITFVYARAVTNYRRNFICGGSFFFTANLAERRLRLLVGHIDAGRQSLTFRRKMTGFAAAQPILRAAIDDRNGAGRAFGRSRVVATKAQTPLLQRRRAREA
jgi:hypothetical protein